MPASYPKRPPFFALRFLRVVLKSCAGQIIGAEGVCLLLAVAQVEDSKRYTDAPTFWNEQLVPLACCRNWAALDRARKRCVEAGWLHYEAGGKSKVGRYWVKIPPHLEVLDDAPLGVNPGDLVDTVSDASVRESHLPHGSITEIKDESEMITGDKREINGRKVEKETGGKRDESGEHSILSLFPNPSPLPKRDHAPTPSEQDLTSTAPRGTENDTPAKDPVAGLGTWVRWRVSDPERTAENRQTLTTLIDRYGIALVQQTSEALALAGDTERGRKPGTKCWPDEILPAILGQQAPGSTIAANPSQVTHQPEIVSQAHALLASQGAPACRVALGWAPTVAPTDEAMRHALEREVLARELVTYFAERRSA